MSALEERYRIIRKKISVACAERPAPLAAREVCLIAVSKGQPPEAIEALYRMGHRDFGENYAQELLGKTQILGERGCSEIRWHFIGHLQTNKAKVLLPSLACLHTLDSSKLAAEVSRHLGARELPVFAEINLDGEPTKEGIAPSQTAAELAEWSLRFPNLRIEGLMAIPAPRASDGEQREAFARLRELEARARPATRGALSMGMSADFANAILEGATHVRIGTSLFGPRETRDRR
jgi:pyridoxal phosphate enzyme (YggS family)